MQVIESEKNHLLTWPSLSLIIITRDRRDLLFKAIESILACDYEESKVEIIVLEETDSPIIDFPKQILYHTIPRRNLGFAYARNQALTYAKNEIIVFTDDDCEVEKDWLKKLIEPLTKDPTVMAVGGAIRVKNCGVIGLCENVLGFPGGGLIYYHKANQRIMSRDTFSTCNCAIRKEVISEIGGFDPKLKSGGEDENLSREIIKRNYTIVYSPFAIVYHKTRDSFKDVFLWFVRRGQAFTRSQKFSINYIYKSPLLRFTILISISLLPKVPFYFLPFVILLYYGAILKKYFWSIRYVKEATFFVPIVRVWMDIAFDYGIIKGLFTKGTKG